MDKHLFNLKVRRGFDGASLATHSVGICGQLAAKQLERLAKKCEKDEKTEKVRRCWRFADPPSHHS